MKTYLFKFSETIVILILAISIVHLTSCSNKAGNSTALQAKIDSLQKEIKKLTDEKAMTELNIRRYDSVDVFAFNNKDIKTVLKYYDKDAIVYNNDGTQTKGLDKIEKDWKEMFETWPNDMKNQGQVVRIGSGDWVASIDHVTGTFTKQMKINGKMFKPTGKKFDMNFATLVRYKNGKIIEEYDFGNDLLLINQLGLEKK